MVAKLNSQFLFLFLCVITLVFKSQNNIVITDYADYKNREQHKKFYKRRHTISEWQINKLKEGALIVKLKTNQLAIDALIKQGKQDLALKKKLEMFAINKTIMLAFKDNYNFSKLYFMFSNYSDSLLNGKRTNLFLDTNLKIDPTLELKENYYLVIEKDFIYNSSIGFVKEDSAKFVRESGNPEIDVAFVIKNKFGFQLHRPFPFFIEYYSMYSKILTGRKFDFPIRVYKDIHQKDSIYFYVNKNFVSEQDEVNKGLRKPTLLKTNETTKIVEIEKNYLYERISLSIENLNSNLLRFLQSSPIPKDSELNDPIIKPYLY